MEDSMDFIENTCDGMPLYAASSMFLGHKSVLSVMVCVSIHTFTDILRYAKFVVHN